MKLIGARPNYYGMKCMMLNVWWLWCIDNVMKCTRGRGQLVLGGGGQLVFRGASKFSNLPAPRATASTSLMSRPVFHLVGLAKDNATYERWKDGQIKLLLTHFFCRADENGASYLQLPGTRWICCARLDRPNTELYTVTIRAHASELYSQLHGILGWFSTPTERHNRLWELL